MAAKKKKPAPAETEFEDVPEQEAAPEPEPTPQLAPVTDEEFPESPYVHMAEAEEETLEKRLEDERAYNERAMATQPRSRRLDSRPWDGTEKRWKPDKLAVEKKVEGRAIKWVRKDNVQTSFANGMRVASRADYGGLAETYGLGGEGEGTGVIQRGNLILMETSQANAEARRKWARMKTENQTSAPTERALDEGLYRKPGHFGAGRYKAAAPPRRVDPT